MKSTRRIDNAERRIDEELVSADLLKHVLCTCCGCKEVVIHRGRHDPPDFSMTIEGERFPAEVTSILSRQQHYSQCRDFARAIQDRAQILGILCGNYALMVSQLPRIPKPVSEHGRQLLDIAIAYIGATRQQVVSPEVQLTQDGSGEISLAKVSANGSSVGIRGSTPPRWESDIQSELAVLIQHAVNDKRRKLEKAGIGSGQALLLLYDAFGYAEPNDVVAALRQVTGYEWFHSIFWAASFFDRKNTTCSEEPGQEGFFLFSNNIGWNKIGTLFASRANRTDPS
jgi:hypothetical protein